ncbi:MAG: flagellar motor protein MotB [bacterium]
MRFLVIFLISVIIVGGLVAYYYYQEEYKPAIEKYSELIDENKTLASYLSDLRSEMEAPASDSVIGDTIIDKFQDTQTERVIQKNISGVRLTLPVGNLFDPGSFQLNKGGRGLIRKTAEILARIDNTEIIVEGHTDNEEIGPSLKKTIPTNWELSALRSINVVKFLQDSAGMSPDRLSAVAYGQTRPIADNSTQEGRRKNRRIEIFVKYAEPQIADIPGSTAEEDSAAAESGEDTLQTNE